MSTDEQPTADAAHADVGIVCALKIELASFLDRCEKVKHYTGGDFTFRGGRYDDIRVAVVESGVGFARARRATQALIDAHTPRWVLSCGFSGALLTEMKTGNIVVADSIADTHGQHLDIDLHMEENRDGGLYVGRLVNSDDLVRTVAQKKSIAESSGAIAVDLESLAVAQVCRERKMRFLAVRVISDDMSADLPPEILSILGSTGTMRVGAAFGAMWKRPGSMKDMWRLRESAGKTAERLAIFLDGVLKQLHETKDE